MSVRPFSVLFLIAVLSGVARTSAAQVNIAGYTIQTERQERVGGNHWILTGNVEIERENTRLYADELEFFVDENRVLARGNVTFVEGENRISSDRAEFNTETRLGTFYNATGSSRVRPPRPSPGAFAAPQLSGSQENDVYFFGEVVAKTGPKKYRITNGGFTTCVQPTPRWNLTADTVVLNVDDYTLLRDAILRVKGVPMLYLPILYYPTTEDDRATGFLIPTYGNSTLRGQMISNAFFWAIGRSHDATIEHDWYSRGAQAVGSEYRYNVGDGDGSVRGYFLNQAPTSYLLDNGGQGYLAGTRSYEFRGSASHRLPRNFRARAAVDYFSDFQTNQTFNTDVYDFTRNRRTIGANLVGSFAGYSLNGTFDRTEYFGSATSSTLNGSTPRVMLSRSERPLFGNSPLYFSATGEFAHLEKEQRTADTLISQSLFRTDFSPLIRFPFRRWQWFTVNTSLGWRNTFYSRSRIPDTNQTTEENVNRSFFTMQAQLVGPVFTRIFNTPANGYAERFKHSIEPFLNVQRTTDVEEFDRIVIIDGVDTIVGNTTNFTYGLANRIYARRKGGRVSQAQEIVTVDISQSYYTNPQSARYDQNYSTTNGTVESPFSPIKLNARVAPSTNVNGTLSAEIDSEAYQLRTVSATGGYNWTNRVQTNVTWAKRYFIEGVRGFDDPAFLSHYVSLSTNARTSDNRYGGAFSFYYDLSQDSLLQQRLTAFYNAQCCGIAFEYQKSNTVNVFGLPSDRRFFLSFSLAGLGNFSPFNGAMSGVPR